jgi:hypothetical protein
MGLRRSWGALLQLHFLVQRLDSRSKCFHDLANALYLLEFDLQLVDLTQDLVEAGDFGVGHCDEVAGAVVLSLGRLLRLRVELYSIN